jgi:SAM-dependent methyltransferase
MQHSAISSIAQSFADNQEIARFLPELMADLEAAGVPANIIVHLAQPLCQMPRLTRVLDLACGTGQVDCALAEALGCSVVGVAAIPEFIAAAIRLAQERELSHLCSFRCEDIRSAVAQPEEYDIVLLLAVGPIWGNIAQTVAAIRRCVRPGGYMIIADGFLATERDPTCANYAGHRQTLAQLTAHGDVLLEEVLLSPEQITGLRPEDIPRIANRAQMLARMHPNSAAVLTQFVDSMERTVARWQVDMKAAIWLLMKGILIADR